MPVVVSVDPFNRGPAGLHIILPITSTTRGIVSHIEVRPSEGGLVRRSFIKCEDIGSISNERLSKRLGGVAAGTMILAEDALRILLGL